MQSKSALRRMMKARLEAHDPADRQRKSRSIGEKLFQLPFFQKAKRICFYVSLPSEVDTGPMIDEALARGKRVFAPKTDLKRRTLRLYEIKDRASDLEPGILGIPEPKAGCRPAKFSDVQCVIVPGLAFDNDRFRLGHGAGIYDRFLKKLSAQSLRIGLAFSFQIVERLPHESHDENLNWVITD